MTFSNADHLGAVRRGLRTVDRDGVPVHLLTIDRTYDATPGEVWDALTSAERIPRWFLPVSGELEVGGHYQLEGHAGGQVLDCVPPERLSLTWESGGEVSWVDLSLRPVDAGTLLQLDHSAPVDPEKWAEYGPGAVGLGWEGALMGLGEHLADPGLEKVLPPDDLADFFRAAGTAWGEAAIAYGEDPTASRAAAERTVAAYTGG